MTKIHRLYNENTQIDWDYLYKYGTNKVLFKYLSREEYLL